MILATMNKNTYQTDQKHSSVGRCECVHGFCAQNTSQTELQRLHCKMQTTSQLQNRMASLQLAKKHIQVIEICIVDRRDQCSLVSVWWQEQCVQIQPTHTPSVKHGAGLMVCACMAATDTGTVVFIDDVTADSSSTNSELYRSILSAQVQGHASKLIGCHFHSQQQDNDCKDTAKVINEENDLLDKSFTRSKSNWTFISYDEKKT